MLVHLHNTPAMKRRIQLVMPNPKLVVESFVNLVTIGRALRQISDQHLGNKSTSLKAFLSPATSSHQMHPAHTEHRFAAECDSIHDSNIHRVQRAATGQYYHSIPFDEMTRVKQPNTKRDEETTKLQY